MKFTTFNILASAICAVALLGATNSLAAAYTRTGSGGTGIPPAPEVPAPEYLAQAIPLHRHGGPGLGFGY
jgi:hypothetical protein